MAKLLERVTWPLHTGKYGDSWWLLVQNASTKYLGGDQGRKRHLPTLDGWRALALFAVLICHWAAGVYSRADYFALSVPKYGTFALDIFFALSGLLICKLLLEEADKYGSINLTSFYIRRIFRVFLPCLFFIVVVSLLGLITAGWELASCLLFFRNYLPVHLGGHYTAHLWSLSAEEHFYMILPGFLVLVGLRRAPWLSILLAVSCGIWRLVELRLNLLPRILPDVLPGARTDLRFDAFLWGCILAFCVHDRMIALWLRTQFRPWMWLFVALVCIYCVQYQPHMAATWMAMLIPVMLVGPLMHPTWLFSRFLDWGPLRYIGRISYSVYLWQQVFFIPSWQSKSPLLDPWQQMPWSLIAIVVCSVSAHYLVERPLTRIGFKWAAEVRNGAKRELPMNTVASASG